MKRGTAILVAVTCALALAAPVAGAHPLGNFTVNHLTDVSISKDRVSLLYVLDRAEIPTFQKRQQTPTELLADVQNEVARNLRVEVDGRAVPLRFSRPGALAFKAGQGGLKTSRFELPAEVVANGASHVEVHDGTYPDGLGLRAIIARPGEGTAVRSSVPSTDPTNGLRTYPRSVVERPPDQRESSFAVREGAGTLTAPDRRNGTGTKVGSGSGDGFAGVFERAAAGQGVLIFLLLAALAWGGFHALSPGHGKAMVAAYLVGARGTRRDAVLLGGVVTITHTIGVFALGLVTLLLAQYILPEDLYPWLTLVSGAMVAVIGVSVLRSRVRWGRSQRAHAEGHRHDGGHHHHHDHDHHHGEHGHSHAPPERLTGRNLIAMGASAGIIPCPSALVVLLGAISQHQVALGLLLIVTFSLGLAGTLTALGLIVVGARDRVAARAGVNGRIVSALPAVSAIVIVVVGCVLTAQAVPQVL